MAGCGLPVAGSGGQSRWPVRAARVGYPEWVPWPVAGGQSGWPVAGGQWRVASEGYSEWAQGAPGGA